MGVKENRKHERRVCLASVRFMAQRNMGVLSDLEWLEDRERQKKTVELRAKIGLSTVVLEHTRIESFPGQITDDHQFMSFLGPLEAKLSGHLPTPGYYSLCTAPGAVKGVKNKVQIQSIIEAWVLAEAPKLELGSPSSAPRHMMRGKPPGVPFELTLYRWKGAGRLDGRLLLARYSPKDTEVERKRRVRIALETKCPKLKNAKEEGFTSLLLFESNDIALANSAVIGSAVIEEMKMMTNDIPDVIFLVETELEPWVIWVFKDGQQLFPNVSNAGPYYINSHTLLSSSEGL